MGYLLIIKFLLCKSFSPFVFFHNFVYFLLAVLGLQRKQWHPTPVLLPGKSHGRRSLVGCSPWGLEESDTTERLHFHFSLLCVGEGNGNPLQCSRLENPRGGVAQSRTRLKWLSSSSAGSCCWLLGRFFSCCGKQGLLSGSSTRACHCSGLSCCRAQALELGLLGLIVPRLVGSSQIRNQTCVSCVGRQILYHWATREALFFSFQLITPRGFVTRWGNEDGEFVLLLGPTEALDSGRQTVQLSSPHYRGTGAHVPLVFLSCPASVTRRWLCLVLFHMKIQWSSGTARGLLRPALVKERENGWTHVQVQPQAPLVPQASGLILPYPVTHTGFEITKHFMAVEGKR